MNREIKFGHTEERLRELFELIEDILTHNFIGNKTSEGCTARMSGSAPLFLEKTEGSHQGPIMALQENRTFDSY